MNTAFRRLCAVVSTLLLLALWLAHGTAQAQTVNWVNWTAPAGYPSSYSPPPGSAYTYTNQATGTLTLPDSSVVGVTLSGEVMGYSCFAANFAHCTHTWWKNTAQGWGPNTHYPAGTFTSARVPSTPTNANLITQAGYVPAVARHTLTFSQPVTNIIMTIASLGGNTLLSAYRFDEDFTLLSQHTSCATPPVGTTPPINCLAVQGRTLTGKEGSGTVQFTGTYTAISWEVTVPEVYSGFNIGVTSAAFESQAALTAAANATHIPVANGVATLSTTGGSGTGAVTYTVVSGPCTVSGSTLTGTSAGTCRVTATKAGDSTYASLTSPTVTVTVVKPLAVTYHGNGQTYGVAPTDTQAYDANETVTVLGQNFLERSGYSFHGWNTTADGLGTHYPAGSGSFSITDATTLYAQWAPSTYAVTYHANGGDSAPAAQTKTHDQALTLQGAATRTGYTFTGWNTAADGSDTHHAAGSAYTGNAALTLYAQWSINTYAVTYGANGATSGTPPSAQSQTHGQSLTLAGNSGALARTGYSFAGWNTASDGSGTHHATGSAYTGNAALTLYAQWALNTYAVTYGANGATSGSAPAAHTKTYGVDLTLAANSGSLARTDYSFQGWNTAADGSGTRYAASSTYADNAPLTLYAQWQHLPATLSAITPASGSASGGTVVTLTGTYLTGATAVTFGGVAATGVQVLSDTQVQATVPASALGAGGAVNVVVTAPYGSPSLVNAYTYIAKPAAPTSVTATPSGDGSVRVSWTAPADGGAAITGYQAIAYLPDGVTEAGSCTAAAHQTSCVITGLANATPYVFRVSASNAEGAGNGGAAAPWYAPAAALQVPTMGGTAQVTIAGCDASRITSSFTAIPPNPPQRAVFPAGAFRFDASGCSTGETVTVSITYPQPLPHNIQLQKYGPRTLNGPPEWFPAPDGLVLSADRKTISYTVANNGPGDSNNANDAIADPFAPLFIPADPSGIPTLSEWGIALLSLIAAAMGLRTLRRRSPA